MCYSVMIFLLNDELIRFLRKKYGGPMVQAVDVGCGTGIR